MRLVVPAYFLVLGTIVAHAPVVEPKDVKSKFTSILVFGDSYSDNGNGTWVLTNHTFPADPAYFDGRFSNGPVYPEYLRDLLGVQKLLDFAYSGATINNSVVRGLVGPKRILVPSVVDQVNLFLSTSLGETEPSSTLTFLIAGVNDAVAAGQGLNVRALTDSMVNSVILLAMKGFRTFLLPLTQPGAILPYYLLYSNPEAIATQKQFSDDFKSNLTLSLQAATLPPDIVVHLLDEYHALELAMEGARKRGYQPEQPCLKGAFGETSPRTLCDNPEEHLFFDAIHPSTLTHKAIAESLAQVVR